MLNSTWGYGPIWRAYFSQWGCFNQLAKLCETTIPHSLGTWILCHDHDIIWFGSTCIFRNIPAVLKECTINSGCLITMWEMAMGHHGVCSFSSGLAMSWTKVWKMGSLLGTCPLQAYHSTKKVSIWLWHCWGKLHRKMIVLVIWNCRPGHWYFSWWNPPKIFCFMNSMSQSVSVVVSTRHFRP